MTRDALGMLEEEHGRIRRLSCEIDRARDDRTAATSILVDCLLGMLAVHMHLENEVLYPRVLELVPELDNDVLEAYWEHQVAAALSSELAAMGARDGNYWAKTMVLIESMRHHMDEEEQDWFPAVRAGISSTRLRQIGAEMLELRPTAPFPAERLTPRQTTGTVLGPVPSGQLWAPHRVRPSYRSPRVG
jgi:hemerythrin-like domain-containing protein